MFEHINVKWHKALWVKMTVTLALWCKQTPCRLLLVLSHAPWMLLPFPKVRMKILHNTADRHASHFFKIFVAGRALWKCLSRRRWWDRCSPTCLQSLADILSAGNTVLEETLRLWETKKNVHVPCLSKMSVCRCTIFCKSKISVGGKVENWSESCHSKGKGTVSLLRLLTRLFCR